MKNFLVLKTRYKLSSGYAVDLDENKNLKKCANESQYCLKKENTATFHSSDPPFLKGGLEFSKID